MGRNPGNLRADFWRFRSTIRTGRHPPRSHAKRSPSHPLHGRSSRRLVRPTPHPPPTQAPRWAPRDPDLSEPASRARRIRGAAVRKRSRTTTTTRETNASSPSRHWRLDSGPCNRDLTLRLWHLSPGACSIRGNEIRATLDRVRVRFPPHWALLTFGCKGTSILATRIQQNQFLLQLNLSSQSATP